MTARRVAAPLLGVVLAAVLFPGTWSLDGMAREGQLGPGFWPRLALLGLALACAAKGLEERALGSFLTAIELDSRHIPAHVESAKIYMATKKFGSAHEMLAKILARGVEDADVFALMAATCNRLRRHREALDACQKALQIQPGHPLATQEQLTANRAKWFAR